MEWTAVVGAACTGEYVQIDRNKQVKFSWTSTGCKSATNSETLVTVTLKEHGDTTEKKLVHEGLMLASATMTTSLAGHQRSTTLRQKSSQSLM